MNARMLLLAGLTALIGACGGRSLEKEIERHPARVLPEEATQVVFARVNRLSVNPAATWAYTKARDLPWGQAFAGVSRSLDLAGPLTRMALGTYGTGNRPPATVVVATGRFLPEDFGAALDEAEVPHIEGSYRDKQYHICGRGDQRCYVAFPSPRVVIAASREDLLKRTLDLTRSGRKSLANDRAFASLLESFSPELDLWGTGLIPAHFLAQLAQLLPPAMQAPVQYIQAFTVKLWGQETKRLSLTLHCTSGEAAQVNAELLRVLLGSIPIQLYQLGFRVAELETALENSEIIVAGADADFQIAFSRTDLTNLVEALRAGPTEQPDLESILPGDLPPRLPGAPTTVPAEIPGEIPLPPGLPGAPTTVPAEIPGDIQRPPGLPPPGGPAEIPGDVPSPAAPQPGAPDRL